MHTVELTEDELRLVRSALHAYLDDFGHEEADVLRDVKAMLAKIETSGERRVTAEHLTIERLADLLRATERAHGAYEKELGAGDPDWPTWYSTYILDRLEGD